MPLGDLNSRFNRIFDRFGDGGGGTRSGSGVIRGTSGNDVLIGAPDSENTFLGLDGSDQILGGNSQDTVFAGRGGSLALGQGGGDRLFGSFGNDLLAGQDGNDRIFAGLGDDQVSGGAGDDFITGDLGNDTLLGDEGDDTISGGLGLDIILGGAGDDTINGGGSGDVLFGGDGNDTLSGGTNGVTVLPDGTVFADEFIVGGAGSDTLRGFGGGENQTPEVDNLIGGGFVDAAGNVDPLVNDADPDLYVLGDENGTFYVGNGAADFALLWGFVPGVDSLVLGNTDPAAFAFTDAALDIPLLGPTGGTAIFVDTPAGPDLVSFVIGVPTTAFNVS